MQLTAVFEEVPEGYIGFVEELPGANTQDATLASMKRIDLVRHLERYGCQPL